ncbi:MAG: LacI family DNA-binding transcriptional regulator [Anaerolineaceae bacterium]|nr:LacI family DNA-binding transcriptional regulator [Anaerolineaceae bacterium]
MAKITIGDVAEYAQVSQATVSRVLNGNDTVDKELSARVLEAVRVLNYTPNRMARRLRKESHDVIGLIVSDIQNPHFVSVIKGVEETAYTNELNVLLCSTNEDSSRLKKYVEVMRAESVAGLIVVPTSDEDAAILATLREYNIPIVVLDRIIEGFEADGVRSDNEDGAYQLTQHLLDNGYRRIAIVYPNLKTGFERREGYEAALQERNIPIDPALVKNVGPHIEDGYQNTRDILAGSNLPEAIFTATNLLTLGALRALRECRFRVPQDIALVGFDDLPWGDEFAIPVTVAAQQTYQLGKTAVEVLVRRLGDDSLPYTTHNLKTELIIRESSGVSTSPRPFV